MTKYNAVKAGEWIQPSRGGWKMKCCDCGLVHLFKFRLISYANGSRRKIQFQAFRSVVEGER